MLNIILQVCPQMLPHQAGQPRGVVLLTSFPLKHTPAPQHGNALSISSCDSLF